MYSSSQQVEDHLECYPLQRFVDDGRPGRADLTPFMQQQLEDRQRFVDQMQLDNLEEYDAYWNRALKYYEQQF